MILDCNDQAAGSPTLSQTRFIALNLLADRDKKPSSLSFYIRPSRCAQSTVDSAYSNSVPRSPPSMSLPRDALKQAVLSFLALVPEIPQTAALAAMCAPELRVEVLPASLGFTTRTKEQFLLEASGLLKMLPNFHVRVNYSVSCCCSIFPRHLQFQADPEELIVSEGVDVVVVHVRSSPFTLPIISLL